MSKKTQHFSVEYVASRALPVTLKHLEFFLFFPLKATVCLASLCSKKSAKIYHGVLGREDKRSLVACFDTWNECAPSTAMIFFLCSLAPKRSPCIMQELEEPPPFMWPCRPSAGYLVCLVFLSHVNQRPSERSACLRLNFACTCLNSFSLLKMNAHFYFLVLSVEVVGKGINELK